jgi:hypothetical protein
MMIASSYPLSRFIILVIKSLTHEIRSKMLADRSPGAQQGSFFIVRIRMN